MRIILFPALFCIFGAAKALAEDFDPAGADALFREGRKAADGGDYVAACPKFEESYRLEPALGTLLNLADCEENRGQVTRAWRHFRQLYDELPMTDARKALADSRARALEPRTPKLRIVLVATTPSRVARDDVVLGPASLSTSLPVDPGAHVIIVTSPGRENKRYEVSVGEGESKEIAVSSGAPLANVASLPQDVPVAAHSESQAPPQASNTRGTVAIVLGGVGVASVLAGSVFGIVALSNLASSNAGCTGNVCSNQDAINQYNRAQTFAPIADVTIGVGIVLIGTALILAFTGPRRSDVAFVQPLWLGGRF